MLSEISTEQFAKWRAYESIEPFGPERADFLVAHLIWSISTIMHGKAPEVPIETFTLEYGVDIDPVEEAKRSVAKQSTGRENILHAMRDLMSTYGGKVVKVKP